MPPAFPAFRPLGAAPLEVDELEAVDEAGVPATVVVVGVTVTLSVTKDGVTDGAIEEETGVLRETLSVWSQGKKICGSRSQLLTRSTGPMRWPRAPGWQRL